MAEQNGVTYKYIKALEQCTIPKVYENIIKNQQAYEEQETQLKKHLKFQGE